MRRLLGAVATGVLAATGPAADAVSPPAAIDAWVAKLGDPAFRVREDAARRLVAEGAVALPALDRAKYSPDAEVRRRAEDLADRVRRADESARLVAPKRVSLDLHAVPLGQAVAELKARTGIALTLDGGRVADVNRRVTVRVDDVPAWEAVDAFCAAAGLREAFRDDLAGPAQPDRAAVVRGNPQFAYYGPVQAPPVVPGQVPVVLRDGRPERLPGDRTTAVRVLALPAHFPANRLIRGAGLTVLNLDVTPLPGVRWDATTAVRVDRAEDEIGRPVFPAVLPESRAAEAVYDDVVLGFNGQMFVNGFDVTTGPAAAAARPNPRVVPVVLQTGDRAAKSLRVLGGVVVGEMTLSDQPLAAVEELAKAVGVVTHGPNDLTVTVSAYDVASDGKATVRVRLDAPNPWAVQRLGRRAGGFGGVNVGLTWEGGAATDPRARFRFADAAGESLPPPVVQSPNGGNDGVRQWVEFTFTFPRSQKDRPPARLVFVGDKAVTVEVPFKLRDVPLP